MGTFGRNLSANQLAESSLLGNQAINTVNGNTGFTNALTPLPTVVNESSSGQKNSQTSGVTDTTSSNTGTTNFNKQNTTDSAIAALNSIIQQQGGNSLLDGQDAGKKKQQKDLQDRIAGLDPTRAGELAAGRTAELSRNLTDQVLPEIFGGAENAGFGGDALSQLLAQDAAIRTGEASARVEEETRSNVQNQATQAQQVLTGLLDSGSGTMDALLQALSTGVIMKLFFNILISLFMFFILNSNFLVREFVSVCLICIKKCFFHRKNSVSGFANL